MSATKTAPSREIRPCGALRVIAFSHPQGCRSYLLFDPASRQAMVIDPHLDAVADIAAALRGEGLTLPYVVDSHTHADHPSGAASLATVFSSTRIGPQANHRDVTRPPADGEAVHLGDVPVRIRNAPGHTPDGVVLQVDGALFSGDSLFIGGVARTDFLGGDAGRLFDTLGSVLPGLPDSTTLYPGHDYDGRIGSTIGEERANNPWLKVRDRAEFVRQLTANPPPRPANMDALLAMNGEARPVAERVPAIEAITRVRAGGATSVIDVRSGVEWDVEHVPGSRHVPLDEIGRRADEVRATPAPRLLLCRTGRRADAAREALVALGVGALSVVDGGLEAYRGAGGETARGSVRMTLERQVRVVAGSLGLSGSLLAALVHPAFVAIPAFIGAGLLFAGLTDWCGMGLLLARMPWNRRRPGEPAAVASACAASAPAASGAIEP